MMSYYAIEIHASERIQEQLREAEQRRILRAATADPGRRRSRRARLSLATVRRLSRAGWAS